MEEYQKYWSLLYSIAYQMVGSLQDAEDIVQELFADLQVKNIRQINHIQSYLTKAVTNRCINFLQSARKKREIYVGEWLPEPECKQIEQNPADSIIKAEMISYAFMVLMSRLNPIERAIFMFREVFNYSYKEISFILQKSDVNCRKIHSRIKNKLKGEFSLTTDRINEQRLAELFIHSTKTGDFAEFADRLAKEAILYADGGGKVRSAIKPIYGRKRIYAFFNGITSKGSLSGHFQVVDINGGRGVLIKRTNQPIYAICFAWDQKLDFIKHIYMVSNPDKLKQIKI
ncbi:RNA polymerase sigma-70 factor [Bacillus sp. WMMC1349]|uniref:RNA polymerase sigma-70 factor n=1 Tax=Bacillus sp. WMMC1349 TaxID=2736254 RepID=UPI001556A12F|nr:RNA polymerase sigma-70 factor [Bacillus sp. WMMC1349]NPC94884.1 RNA polymerase sigma-70 factor [Bacillus sp. WMMC1349]